MADDAAASLSVGHRRLSPRSASWKGAMSPHSIGSLWTVEMLKLKQAGSFFEAVECLRNVRGMLEGIDRKDRMRFCKQDYENATKSLRKIKLIWSDDLFREVTSITLDYFNGSPFCQLPDAVTLDIFLWLPAHSYAVMTCVSTDWRTMCHSNEMWTLLYINKFLCNNPGPSPRPTLQLSQMAAFRERLEDPSVGDKIEVAWRGKFRLETQDVYQGLAWWLAEVVEKDSAQARYKIRYPGWDSKWDEWVPRSRLRWTVHRNRLDVIEPTDLVELWCCGANVPGAWLEAKVKKVRGERYCLGRVLSSGLLWVERNRLRLVKKSSRSAVKADARAVHPSGGTSLSMMSSRIRSSFRSGMTSCTIS